MEFPECSICLDIYGNSQIHERTPKVLKCGDSICKKCLEDIINRSETDFFECPQCRMQIKKEQDYTTNKELIRLIDSSFKLPEKEIIQQEDNPIIYSIISLRNSGVGKTCIFERLLTDDFRGDSYCTVGIEFFHYYVKYKDKKYKLIFHDTGREEKYRAITKSYIKSADGVLFLFSLFDNNSFEELEMWYKLYQENKGKVVGVLIGNKSDIIDEERQVKNEDAQQFAEEHGLEYFEGSAKKR